MELEGLQHKCGIGGFIHCRDDDKATIDVPNLISLVLVGLQHRGQEAAGMVVSKGKAENSEEFPLLLKYRNVGQINAMFTPEILGNLRGLLGIGHSRYSTQGVSNFNNCQPFVVETTHGEFAVAHNGELTNASAVRKQLLKQGIGLSTTSDSELITQLLCHSPEMHGEDIDWASRIKRLMSVAPLSYSLLIMHRDTIIAVRDIYGNRPLCLGRVIDLSRSALKKGNESPNFLTDDENDKTLGWVVSSESCVFASMGARFEREVLPGEIVEMKKSGIKSIGLVTNPLVKQLSFCIFEYIYFARPDSFFEGQQVHAVRQRCGRQLAIESPADVDIVSTVPDSATPAAHGYAQQLGLPYVEVLTKNRYVGRTFIQPTPHLRKLAVLKKFGVLDDNFKGKRIVLLDDSIVRGNTMAPIVTLLRSAGALEVHVRVASPPIKNPCFMGINIPTREELIANYKSPEELANHVGADSLKYLSVEGLHSAIGAGISPDRRSGHCDACLTGNYPVEIDF